MLKFLTEIPQSDGEWLSKLRSIDVTPVWPCASPRTFPFASTTCTDLLSNDGGVTNGISTMGKWVASDQLHQNRAMWEWCRLLPNNGFHLRYAILTRILWTRFWIWRLILGDVPMSRVKMNAKQEYEYLANFKVLQGIFKSRKIDKVSTHCFPMNAQSLTCG
jgi:hypothetical protein